MIMDICKQRLNIDNIVKKFQDLIIKYNNLYPTPSNDTQMNVDILPPVQGKILIKERIDNYLALMGEFELLANQLEEFKQSVGEKKYDDDIYRFMQYVDGELLVQQLRRGKVDMDIVLKGKEKYRLYGLVPRSQLIMQCISTPLKVLYYLWNHPVEGVNQPQYQL